MTTDPDFNPALRDWLNARDYCSGDWPHNVPDDILQAADIRFGGGHLLAVDGWPGAPVAYPDAYPHDPIYLGA